MDFGGDSGLTFEEEFERFLIRRPSLSFADCEAYQIRRCSLRNGGKPADVEGI